MLRIINFILKEIIKIFLNVLNCKHVRNHSDVSLSLSFNDRILIILSWHFRTFKVLVVMPMLLIYWRKLIDVGPIFPKLSFEKYSKFVNFNVVYYNDIFCKNSNNISSANSKFSIKNRLALFCHTKPWYDIESMAKY